MSQLTSRFQLYHSLNFKIKKALDNFTCIDQRGHEQALLWLYLVIHIICSVPTYIIYKQSESGMNQSVCSSIFMDMDITPTDTYTTLNPQFVIILISSTTTYLSFGVLVYCFCDSLHLQILPYGSKENGCMCQINNVHQLITTINYFNINSRGNCLVKILFYF